jgi:hypothetical protein
MAGETYFYVATAWDGTKESAFSNQVTGWFHEAPRPDRWAAGIDAIRGITISADAKAYVYGHIRTLSDLYLVEGLT